MCTLLHGHQFNGSLWPTHKPLTVQPNADDGTLIIDIITITPISMGLAATASDANSVRTFCVKNHEKTVKKKMKKC